MLPRRSSRCYPFAASLLVLIISVAVSLIAAEWGIRLVLPHFDPTGQIEFTSLPGGIGIGPPNAVLRQVKNTGDFDVTVRFNALGFRDDKLVSSSNAGSIFAAGDSFTFGWGVRQEDRFSDQLAARLGRMVFNIAIPGDFDDYAALIAYAERNGAVIGTLVVGVCMENDLLDYTVKAKAAEVRGPEPTGFGAWLSRVKPWLRDRSALYFLVTSTIHAHPVLKEMAVKVGLLVPNLQLISLNISDDVVRASVERLKTLVRDRRAVVLIIPARHLWVGSDSNRKAMAHVHDAFTRAAAEAGLVVVDPRARIEASGRPLTYHFDNDGHWNAKGHALAAEMLAERISQLGW